MKIKKKIWHKATQSQWLPWSWAPLQVCGSLVEPLCPCPHQLCPLAGHGGPGSRPLGQPADALPGYVQSMKTKRSSKPFRPATCKKDSEVEMFKVFHSDSKQLQHNWIRITNNPWIVVLWCPPQCRACWPRWADWSKSGDWGHLPLSGLGWGCQRKSCCQTCKCPESEPQDQFSPQSVGGRPPGNIQQGGKKTH